jgi:hypothetical protein
VLEPVCVCVCVCVCGIFKHSTQPAGRDAIYLYTASPAEIAFSILWQYHSGMLTTARHAASASPNKTNMNRLGRLVHLRRRGLGRVTDESVRSLCSVLTSALWPSHAGTFYLQCLLPLFYPLGLLSPCSDISINFFLQRRGWLSGNALNSYSGSPRLESRPGHWLS